MRTLLLGALAAAVAFAQAPAPARARVSTALTGHVVTGTGRDAKPVRRAKVTLTGAGQVAPLVTDTDTKGGFRFEGPGAGNYKVTIQKAGFVTLDAEAFTPGATLTMVRGGALEGVVTDADGDPLWDVVVTALERQTGEGKPKPAAQARTDDLGRYRLHSLRAGDYMVEAATDRAFLARQVVTPGEKRPDVSRAYYPAAATAAEARSVSVPAGRDVSAIDITFAPAMPVKDPAAPPPPPRPDATGTARIAGTLVDATSGKPIKTAAILLVPAAGQGLRLTNWTRTDAQGRFAYTSLPAQKYELSFQAPRFVSLQYGQKRPGEAGIQIQLHDGEDFRADMKLPRASALEGTLLDEFGDPAPNVLVRAARRQYVAGRHRLIPMEGSIQPVPTDDTGHYRISALAPGEYFVIGLSGVYADAGEVGGFAPTYYPGTTDSGAAVPVTVSFGADTSGTTFSLSPARTLSVAGTMVDAEGRPVSGRGDLVLATPDRQRRMEFNFARVATDPGGRFVLRNVPQGAYTLQGFGSPPPDYRGPMNLSAMPFGWLPIAVGDSDLDGVVLKVTGGTSLRGKIVLDDSAGSPLKPDQVRVNTIPVEFDSAPIGGGPSPSDTHNDWTFEVRAQSGLRRIFVNVASPDWTLKKITVNEIDVTDTPVDLRTKDVDGVEVRLTSKVSRISGAVSDDKGPVADYAVVIFPSDSNLWMDRSRFIVLARPTQEGRFDVRGLPPEDYLAVALGNVTGTEYMDPEFLQQLRPVASSFSLQEGESKTLDLKLKKRP